MGQASRQRPRLYSLRQMLREGALSGRPAPDTSPAVTHTESFDVKTIFAHFFIERGRFAGYMFGRGEIEEWAKQQPAGAFYVPAFVDDLTEGGLATGLFELVAPAGLGLRVIREHIPVFPETDTICRALALDPLKLIASGALLIAVAPDRADSVLTAIEATGVPVVVIGEVRP